MSSWNERPIRGAAALAALFCLLLSSASCSKTAALEGGGTSEKGHEDGHAHGSEEGGGEEHENRVELTAAQVEAAGIRVDEASSGEIASILTLPVVVSEDMDGVTHVNPKAPGIVQSIHKHLGESVEKGDLLCVIDSVDLGRAAAAFLRSRALVEAAKTTLERERELFRKRLETADRVLRGSIEINKRIYAREKELQEKSVSTIRPFLEADKSLQNSILNRKRELTELEAQRDTRLLALEVALRERRIDEEAAKNHLIALGLDSATLESMDTDSPFLAGTYEIRAQRKGIVSGRHISTGEFVDAQTKLFTLKDLSHIWILASAFEGQIRSIRTGQTGIVRLDAFPDRNFEGKVTRIDYEVDPESRSLRVRLEMANPDIPEWPEKFPMRPGMFGSVDLIVRRERAAVAIPKTALVHEGGANFVFVLAGKGIFEKRPVVIGRESTENVEVKTGLEPGTTIAVSGTFYLKSALRKGELGEGHSH